MEKTYSGKPRWTKSMEKNSDFTGSPGIWPLNTTLSQHIHRSSITSNKIESIRQLYTFTSQNHVRLEPEFGGKGARWGVELVSTDNEVGQDLVTRNCNTVRGKEWCNVWRATFRLRTEVINETNKQQKIDACVSKWSQLWVDKVSEN